MTAQMAKLVWREQQALQHTLHDTLGQTFTGLGMLSVALSERAARTDPSASETGERIAQQAKQAIEEVRQLS
jgi:signal transduction histidine kinase